MATITDYLKWRGDLTFTQAPFNAIDNLILSCLSYVNLEGIAPEDQGSVTVSEAAAEFFASHTREEIDVKRSIIRSASYLLEALADTRRFGNAEIMHHVNNVSTQKKLQFSAMEILPGDGTSYIAYRGTDDTIVGWKEDFNMSIGNVPAELEAADYLSRIGLANHHMIRVGGHSKGGHLALYAAAKCDPSVQKRILRIYNNDGPGFFQKLEDDEDFKRIQPRIRRFIPEFSIFGMLMHHNTEPVIVKSSNKGITQHDAFSWQLDGPHFLQTAELHPAARVFSDSMTTWLEQTDLADRENFINDVFSVLEVSGAHTTSELQDNGIRNIPAMVKQLNNLRPETKDKVDALLRILVYQWAEFRRS